MSETKSSEPELKSTSETIARVTAVLAVVAAIASARWGACNLSAILEQGKVNDTWAYYQAKSIKQHEAEQGRDLARALVGAAKSEGSGTALADFEKKMAEEARRQEADKVDQKTVAEQFQISRDRMVETSFWYELAFAALQLGVILCTIASGSKRRLPFKAGIAFGVLGAFLLVNGLYRFVHAPSSWYQGISEQMAYEKNAAASQPGQ
jgi:hypothetical protein